MKAPGTAFDHPLFGKDPQPDHIRNYNNGPGDNQMVHVNSGIPNKVFFLVAIGIGGNAWEAPGHIWYESLRASNRLTNFQDFADITYFKAGILYGTGSDEQQTVQAAWKEVGISISGVSAVVSRGRSGRTGQNGDSLAALTKKVESLAKQVKALKDNK
jgi:Zn-dependent metalloprotease